MFALLISMVECIPIIQFEKTFLGTVYGCTWNETAIVAIVGFILLILLVILIKSISDLSKSRIHPSNSQGENGFEISAREVLDINPEKHQKDVFNLVKDTFKTENHKLVESRSPEYLGFVKGSNWLHGKVVTKVKISDLNNKLVLNISSAKNQNWSAPFKEKEIEEFNQNFDKLIRDINKLVKK